MTSQLSGGVWKRTFRGLLPRALQIQSLRRAAGNRVLFTFDDGPQSETTDEILGLLNAFDARALFFVVGNRIPRAPEMLRRIVAEGHALGNHSHEHPLHHTPGYSAYLEDLQKCQHEIYRHCGFHPRFHRPPLGSLTLATCLAPRRIGLISVLWSVSSEDWRFRSDDEALDGARSLVAEIRPRDILLFHDEKRYTAAALKYLLPALSDRGLRFDVDFDTML